MDFQVDPGNTPLDPTEAEGLIPKINTLRELNRAEAINILMAKRWAEGDSQIASDLLNPSTLKQLHKRMFDQTWRWAGKYRQTQKSIGIEAFRISSELKNLTDDVKTWIEFGTYPADEIATRFHHRIVFIHAFPNGNGRHARLATDLLCVQLKVDRFSWGASMDASEVRQNYIAALHLADLHDFSALLEFVRR
jgi:Fic-DOC domain mobile mystery protein B